MNPLLDQEYGLLGSSIKRPVGKSRDWVYYMYLKPTSNKDRRINPVIKRPYMICDLPLIDKISISTNLVSISDLWLC